MMNNIDPLNLPRVFLSEKNKLPKVVAVYFAIAPSNRIIYIGSSSNLHKRWRNHDKLKDFEDYRYIKIAWLEVEEQERENLELLLINKLSPVLNKRGMPCVTDDYIDQELSLHLNRDFISSLIEGIVDGDPFDIAISMKMGLL